MKLRTISSNMTEVENGDVTVLFSYSTPVAAFIAGTGWVRTDKHWSATTSRHINKWIGGIKAEERPQEFFDSLLTLRVNTP